MDTKKLLRDYQYGVGFKHGDILKPRDGVRPFPSDDCIDNTVVVLRQSALAPHQYYIVGERPNPRTPADRFLKAKINGHDWQKIGRA